MNRIKLLGLAIMAILALSVVAVATAAAEEKTKVLPEPTAALPLTNTTTGGESSLVTVSGSKITCKKNSGTASMTSDNLGSFTTLFTECKGPLSTTCTGTGDPSGLIALSGTVHFWLALLGTTLVGALAFLIKEFKFTCTTTGISEEVTVASGCQAA